MNPDLIKIEACEAAIIHVLNRVHRDKEVRYLLGCGTEAFSLLTKAAALLIGTPVDEVREKLIPGSADIHREAE
jgi:hypothetical protein